MLRFGLDVEPWKARGSRGWGPKVDGETMSEGLWAKGQSGGAWGTAKERAEVGGHPRTILSHQEDLGDLGRVSAADSRVQD